MFKFGTMGALWVSGVEDSALTAPVLTWVTGATDNTPQFSVDLPDGVADGVDIEIQASTDSGFGGTPDEQLLGDVAGDPTSLTAADPFADGYFYARARYTDSAWSNIEEQLVDTTGPTLSSATGTETGETTADISVSTNEGNGTLYWVVTQSSTQPSIAQIKAGQNHSGSAAPDSGSQAVSTTGAQTISGGATGLTAGTNYWLHTVQTDTSTNDSNRASSASFTTEGSGASAESSQFLSRLPDTPDGTHDTAYQTLIDGLVTDSLWTKVVGLWIFATETQANGEVNLKSSSYGLTETGAGNLSFTADEGFTGDGTNYYTTGLVPSTASLGQNAIGIGGYIRTNRTSNANYAIIGGVGNSGSPSFNSQSYLIPKCAAGSGGALYPLSDWGVPTSASQATAQGSWHANRTASNSTKLFLNESVDHTDTGSSGAEVNTELFVGAFNNFGSVAYKSQDQIAAAWATTGMSDADVQAFQGRVNDYMIAVGADVY